MSAIIYFFSVFMVYNLHRKLKFKIPKCFENMCPLGGKIEIKK